MSLDTVDILHAAEDEIGRLESILEKIHAAMVVPFDWSADTPEAVAFILEHNGYSFPPSFDPGYTVTEDGDEMFTGLDRFRPEPWTRPEEDS